MSIEMIIMQQPAFENKIRQLLIFLSPFRLNTMSDRSRHHKRRHNYIPEEKYNVDGSLVRNEKAFKNKRWNLKDIVRKKHELHDLFINPSYRSTIEKSFKTQSKKRKSFLNPAKRMVS